MALSGATVFIARRDMVSRITTEQITLHGQPVSRVPQGYSSYNDPRNPSALITLDSVNATNAAISKAFRLRDRAEENYKKLMQKTKGVGREKARNVYWEATGGVLSNFWNVLCKQGHVMSLVVHCPRSDSLGTMQKILKTMIFKINSRLAYQCLDMFFYRNESCSVGETNCICRFAYYLGTAVRNLAAMINIEDFGAHKFNAFTTFEDVEVANARANPVDLWTDVTIGGIPLAELTSEQLEQTSWNLLQPLGEHHKAILNASQFEQDPEEEMHEMQNIIFPDEIEQIHQMKTWTYAQEILQGGKVKDMAMFKMAGDIIRVHYVRSHLGTSGAFTIQTSGYPCQVFEGSVEWYPEADMFLNNGIGNYFVTFDPPIFLKMRGNGINLFPDGPGGKGIIAFYCIQYNMLEDGQMTINKAGIVFQQHVQVNLARLSALQSAMHEFVMLGLGNSPNDGNVQDGL